MSSRTNYASAAPEVYKAMRALQDKANDTTLDKPLLELVKIRASQMNGCSFCLDLHTREARAIGVSDQRVHLVAAWRDAACYSERERAALAWCEALTLVASSQVPDDVYEAAGRLFTDKELAELSLIVVAINGWNRLSVAFRVQPPERKA